MKSSNVQLSSKDLLSMFTDLSTMLTAGIPILEALESLEADSKGRMKSVLAGLKQSLLNGEPLSLGMQRFPRTFDPVILNIMRAAEAGGTLEETLHNVVQTLKKEVAFSESIRTAMIYPAFVGVVFTGIIVLMLTFVIPRISQVFSSMHVDMPLVTRIMIAASDYFVANWIWVSAAFIAFLFVCYLIFKANSRSITRAILSLPVLNTLGRNIDLARLTRSFALLLHSGVPLDEALRLSQRVVRKTDVIAVLDHMQRNIESGKSLAQGLRDGHASVPPIMIRSIETAETSGTLDQTLTNLAEYFDEQVADSLKIVSSLLEPVMIVVIGAMVGALMITIIAPIYNLISQVNPK